MALSGGDIMLTCTKTELKDLNKLVEENLPLVGYVISKYYPSIVGTPEYDDYFQSGAVGLVIAAKKFNPRLGYAFSTYAVPTIHGYMRRPSILSGSC
jgi:RNA polymerase sigma-B factor